MLFFVTIHYYSNISCLCLCVEDGAYLVRDSTRQLANQPYTLMVFYQDKVYNVQIRQQNQQFLLGTGLKVQEVNKTHVTD